MATSTRRWRLLALLIGPVFLTLGLTAAANYYSHRITVAGYQAASERHVATIRAGFEANEVSARTLGLIQDIAEEINARRAGLRGPEDWPAFRQSQQAVLSAQQQRLQALLEAERDPERQGALRQALVLMTDLERFLAQSDRLMSQPLDVVNRELLASRNTSLRYAVQLQQFNEAMSREAVAHALGAEFEAESLSWRSTAISGAGLLLAAVIWAVVAIVLARRLEVLDSALRHLAEHDGHEAHDFSDVRHIARAHNPLTSTLARSVLTLQEVQAQRDAAQVALGEREQLFATIVQQAPAAIALIERETLRLLRFNQAASDSLGYSNEEFSQLKLYDLAFGPHTRSAEIVEQVFAGNGVEFETSTTTKQGNLRDFWVSMKPLVMPGRDCISAIWLDITERKRTELELDRHRQHLAALVAERTQDLERTQQDLIAARDMAESANRAKSAFLANMSHEIRTPMNAIVGMAHLLKGDALSPQQHQRVDKITTAAMHLLSVINDILDFSKIEAGKFGVDRIDFNLEQVVSQALSFVAEKAESKGLALASDLDGVPTGLHGDPVRLRQILLNFLSNAVKFTERGHVRLQVRPLPAEPAQGVQAVQWLRFEITDTGIGIGPAHQARLFTAFQQADDSTTRVYGGTGLGLAICRRLAELLGGRVGVHSTVGVGSTFWAELPFTMARQTSPSPVVAVSAPTDAPAEGPQASQPVRGGALQATGPCFPPGLKLLLAEDNPLNREVLGELLERFGLAVACVQDGVAAIEAARQMQYDLVLMDLQMPRLDGLAAARELRQLPGYETTPIVAVTANAFDEDRLNALAAGMNDHVPKPVDPRALHAVLRRWLPTQGGSGGPHAIGTDGAPASASDPGATARADDAEPLKALARIPGLHVAQALRHTGGSPQQLLERLHRFVADHGDDAAGISASWARNDLEGASRQAHTLRGVAGMFGLGPLAEAAHAVGQLLREGCRDDSPEARDALQCLQKLLLGARDALGAPAGSPNAAQQDAVADPAARAGEAALRDRLQALRDDLAAGNIEAAAAWEALAPLVRARCPGHASAVAQAIDVFDYARAAQEVAQLSRALAD